MFAFAVVAVARFLGAAVLLLAAAVATAGGASKMRGLELPVAARVSRTMVAWFAEARRVSGAVRRVGRMAGGRAGGWVRARARRAGGKGWGEAAGRTYEGIEFSFFEVLESRECGDRGEGEGGLGMSWWWRWWMWVVGGRWRREVVYVVVVA